MKQKLSLFVAVACICGGGGYKVQAQLVIDVYPSQDNPTSETLWIFSGSSGANSDGSVRTSSGSNNLGYVGTWWFATPNDGNISNANPP